MKHYQDERGKLSVIDDRNIPFRIRRVFWITDVPPPAARGHHAHRDCEQVIICAAGSFDLHLDGKKRTMTGYSEMAHAPAGCYISLDNFSPDAVCLVLCSEYYNASDVY